MHGMEKQEIGRKEEKYLLISVMYIHMHVCMCGCFLNLPSAILVLYSNINECRRNPAVCMAFFLHSIV